MIIIGLASSSPRFGVRTRLSRTCLDIAATAVQIGAHMVRPRRCLSLEEVPALCKMFTRQYNPDVLRIFMGRRTSVEVGGEKRGTLAKRCQMSCDLYFLDAVFHHGAVATAVGRSTVEGGQQRGTSRKEVFEYIEEGMSSADGEVSHFSLHRNTLHLFTHPK